MSGFKDELKQAVRQMAFRTSVDSLKKKGVQVVNVLGIDRIIALIEEAVHRSLRSRLAGIERDAVADATKAEFLRLLRSNEDLQRQKTEIERLKERAEEEVDQLRRELAAGRHELQLKLDEGGIAAASRYEGENVAIARKVAEVLGALAGSGNLSLATAQEKVFELVMDVVTDERKASEFARRALHDREVELLQRRVAKLNDSLSLTERRLQEVAAMKNIDDGISSVYREAQGLSADAAQAGKKRELMAEIFQANLKLRNRNGS